MDSTATTEWSAVLEEWAPTRAHALWRAHSDAMNRSLLRRWLPSGDLGEVLKTDLFDEAVGGGLAGWLAPRTTRMVGVDLAPAVAEAAAARWPAITTVVADVRELPFDSASFDFVVSNSTLDHFPSFDSVVVALRELARVTRPGGKLIITLDNRQNPVVALRTSKALAGLFRRLGIVPYELGATCGRRRLVGLLEDCGFTVEATEAIMHCPPQVASKLTDRFADGAGEELEARHLRRVLRFEVLSAWPTRYLTGHFVAACAIRDAGAGQI
jgi:SAM-dependent methyltransferase